MSKKLYCWRDKERVCDETCAALDDGNHSLFGVKQCCFVVAAMLAERSLNEISQWDLGNDVRYYCESLDGIAGALERISEAVNDDA